ncbi:GNAT family N-acetyltransferase [Rhizobium tumorigenes]|uniref:GNAT family N-acetyltransferase n=1 Tax=Rhizobium tumorigenes TaxID=2041385 RepID=UPI00241E1414|nr:GNAT family N-acetyltransferase [Rhizobium tumorigenes]WFR99706.1 GNAT family N-acetyltransferase [Rhizobium tumorigenes]
MTHILDRPVWNTLQTSHAPLAIGGPLAKRFASSTVPFAAAGDDTSESLQALANLPIGDERIVLVEAAPIVIPEGIIVLAEGELYQMTADRPHERIADPRIEMLDESDAAEMLELALLTKPGPFTLGAQKLGPFWGVKIEGRLVAMAGQRMRLPGFGELSGLCTHPDFQGRGLGSLLFRFVAGEIAARGEVVFLHAYVGNTAAIALYQALGFSIRATMNMRAVQRQA